MIGLCGLPNEVKSPLTFLSDSPSPPTNDSMPLLSPPVALSHSEPKRKQPQCECPQTDPSSLSGTAIEGLSPHLF